MTGAVTHPDMKGPGDALERALKDLNDHIGGCQFCAWLGDSCDERDTLFTALSAAWHARDKVARRRRGYLPNAETAR